MRIVLAKVENGKWEIDAEILRRWLIDEFKAIGLNRFFNYGGPSLDVKVVGRAGCYKAAVKCQQDLSLLVGRSEP